MRLGLFGKILAAFWATLVALGLVLMLLFGSTPYQDRPTVRLAPSFLGLLENTLEREGPNAAERERRMLEGSMRERITIARADTGAAVAETATRRLAVAPDGGTYVLEFRRDRSRALSKVSKKALWGGALAGLLFSVGLAWYLGRPVRLLRDGFHRLAEGALDVRLGPSIGRRNDEIADLARDFDRMADRLGQLVTARDRLLNDVSHELRSPLTRLQLAIGLARQDRARRETSLNRIEHEAQKLDRLVDELLTLARAESGAEVTEFFDPVGVVEATICDAELEAEAKGVIFALQSETLEEEARPVVAGSAELFHRAIENVVRNAVRFAPSGSGVEIEATLLEAPLRYRIAVLDRGPGVAPELVDKLLEPFVRADRSGTGLGLAIANRAIRAHGGTIACSNRPGGGFAVEIEVGATKLPD